MIVAPAGRVLLALIAGALAVALLVACAGTHGSETFKVPDGIDEDDLRARAVVKAKDRIRVAAAVPNDGPQ